MAFLAISGSSNSSLFTRLLVMKSFGLIVIVNINKTLGIKRFAGSEYGSLLVVLSIDKES